MVLPRRGRARNSWTEVSSAVIHFGLTCAPGTRGDRPGEGLDRSLGPKLRGSCSPVRARASIVCSRSFALIFHIAIPGAVVFRCHRQASRSPVACSTEKVGCIVRQAPLVSSVMLVVLTLALTPLADAAGAPPDSVLGVRCADIYLFGIDRQEYFRAGLIREGWGLET